MSAEKFLPKLPELNFLGDDVSYGYDASDMREYALEAVNAALATQADAPEAGQEADTKLRAFVLKVSRQKPEKPDYWSSCGQCEHNISDAEDLIAALSGSLGDSGGKG